MTVNLPQIADGEDKSSVFGNCIRKNYRHIRKWAKRTNTDAFRIYDRDVHHYPLAIDFYAGRYNVQYFGKGVDSDEIPQELQDEVKEVLMRVLGAEPSNIYFRTRARSKESRQYEKRGESGEFFTCLEYGVKFWINLEDYLDTGLFLDHRETRQRVAKLAKEKYVLNLFAYTCSFSVHAALAGAKFTKSVDMSNTYTEWGWNNFQVNDLPEKGNKIIRADCLKFLDEEIQDGTKYDIIIIDPPTISRSKKMTQLFDIQQDYIFLLSKGLELLTPNGVIFFSTNSRKFTLDPSQLPPCNIRDISKNTLPLDFRNEKIHQCWEIRKF